jgi:hypothetical protein
MDDLTRPNRLRLTSSIVFLGLIALCGLVLSGCGGSSKSGNGGAKTTSTVVATSKTLARGGDTFVAPKSFDLTVGKSVDVTAKTLTTTGWQASCTGGGRRLDAESLRGQITRAGRIIALKGGPGIWITFHKDHSITIACRKL